MNDRRLFTLLFAAAVVLQLGVPISSILAREWTLRQGTAVKLRTAPVDPYDAFRGRYVALSFEDSRVTEKEHSLERGQEVYVLLDVDADGFAEVGDLRLERPADATPFFRAEVSWTSGNDVQLHFPFDRYYLDERKAPAAEAAYRRHSTRQERDAWVVLRLRGGDAVIEELVVAGKPIHEYLRDSAARGDGG